MPPDLPYPCTVDEKGRIRPEEGGNECPLVEGTRVVPQARWEAIRLHLLDAAYYGETAALTVKEHNRYWRVVTAGALGAQEARLTTEHLTERAELEQRPTWWDCTLKFLGGVGVGVILGGLVVGVMVAALAL